jgi:Zn-dependent protease
MGLRDWKNKETAARSAYEGDRLNLNRGAIPLGSVAGIRLFLHWSWFLVAAIEIEAGTGRYSSVVWNVLEYLSIFAIVLLHEFGHAFACRQVGGTANQIMLWPLGGIAYVDPPQRPGATLWSIAAGPLVNVALLPLLWGAHHVGASAGWADSMPDVYQFLGAVLWINIILLAFNLLPIYPLDGGKILWALLWFFLGRARSLMVATVLGFFGIIAYVCLALYVGITWAIVMAIYMAVNCWSSFKYARGLMEFDKLPRRGGFACPSCRKAPPIGDYWRCKQCQQGFDTFQTGAVCPHCGAGYPATVCLDCRRSSPMSEWMKSGGTAGATGTFGQTDLTGTL